MKLYLNRIMIMGIVNDRRVLNFRREGQQKITYIKRKSLLNQGFSNSLVTMRFLVGKMRFFVGRVNLSFQKQNNPINSGLCLLNQFYLSLCCKVGTFAYCRLNAIRCSLENNAWMFPVNNRY